MRFPRPLYALCCWALLGAHAAAAEPEAATIKLPQPWKPGQVLEYETERVKTATAPGKREKTVSASTTEVRTVESTPDGSLQEWRWRNARETVLEGDKAATAAMAKAIEDLEARDFALAIELDAAGDFRRVRNIEEAARLFRQAMRPPMLGLMTAAAAKDLDGADPQRRQQAMDKAAEETDALLLRFTEPKLLETMLTREIQTLLNFTGVELEDEQSYRIATELENPTGGAAFPATLTFGLYQAEDDPADVYVEWTLEIDPEKGVGAIWDTLERLYGRKIGEAERAQAPAQVSIVDQGFILFERATGLPEMFQNVRTVKLGERASYERHRMRLLEAGHGHEWAGQNPQDTEPQLSASERDAQLCADDGADAMAAIAACSRALDRTDLEPAKRAEWYAQRGWHRRGAGQDQAAASDFDRAIALVDDARYRAWRSNARRRMGEGASALEDAERAVALAPKWAYAHVVQAFAHERLKQWDRAVAAYDEAMRIDPRDAGIADGRCWAKAMAGDLAGGKADCDRALQLDPRLGNSYNSRGYIQYRLGNHAEAVADNGKALEHEPDVASSWYVRGLARRALGDTAGADADIARALALDPDVAARYAGYEPE